MMNVNLFLLTINSPQLLVFQQMRFYIENKSLCDGSLKIFSKKNGGGILLEDDTVIVINKPAGLLVLAGPVRSGN